MHLKMEGLGVSSKVLCVINFRFGIYPKWILNRQKMFISVKICIKIFMMNKYILENIWSTRAISLFIKGMLTVGWRKLIKQVNLSHFLNVSIAVPQMLTLNYICQHIVKLRIFGLFKRL